MVQSRHRAGTSMHHQAVKGSHAWCRAALWSSSGARRPHCSTNRAGEQCTRLSRGVLSAVQPYTLAPRQDWYRGPSQCPTSNSLVPNRESSSCHNSEHPIDLCHYFDWSFQVKSLIEARQKMFVFQIMRHFLSWGCTCKQQQWPTAEDDKTFQILKQISIYMALPYFRIKRSNNCFFFSPPI